jgi:NAD(P)-dependent dehydrogenase (short-subunit alcohol dehydrogenase family)
MNIDNGVAVVSGGASGLGYAAAKRLGEAGAKVVILDLNSERGIESVKELGPNAHFRQCDVTDENQVEQAFDYAAELGPVRVVVSCAGIGWVERTLNREGNPHGFKAFEQVQRVNVFGTFNLLRLGAATIAKSEPIDTQRGVIINTASVAAYDGQIGQLAYAASKGAIVSMTLPAARDLSVVGIRVMAIAPGIMDTPLIAMLSDPAKEALARDVCFPKRLGTPHDFGLLVGSIVENDYLNGEVIRLDGALRMPPK